MSQVIVLRGGPHEGRSASVANEVTRVYLPAEAPGMLDVYEMADETDLDADDALRSVFRYADQVPADPAYPEILHPIDLPD
jgi:hypothetical protein